MSPTYHIKAFFRFTPRTYVLLIALCLLYFTPLTPTITAHPSNQATAQSRHRVQIGDTWLALSYQYNLSIAALQAANPHPNPYRQPTIGTDITIPATATAVTNGRFHPTPTAQSLLTIARNQNLSPWHLALSNHLLSPYHPPTTPLFIPSGPTPPRQYPPTFTSLSRPPAPTQPGTALALHGQRPADSPPVTIQLLATNQPANNWATFTNDHNLIALTGTGAFYPKGHHLLTIALPNTAVWQQPWAMTAGDWTWEEITLTGTAAAIDQASIDAERADLFTIWNQATNTPHWQAPFQAPIKTYLAYSSRYGARRSYNDGPYRTYHEGVDYSAYGGTPVYAAAAGVVVVADTLYVRGGAVIIDHGLGIYTGVYHLSEVTTTVGTTVTAGQQIGAVGSTGFSTGNHLHWDFLVNGVWVDALSWQAHTLDTWLLTAWHAPYPPDL